MVGAGRLLWVVPRNGHNRSLHFSPHRLASMIARANKKDQPPPTTVIAKPEGLWQSVTPAARCAARPPVGPERCGLPHQCAHWFAMTEVIEGWSRFARGAVVDADRAAERSMTVPYIGLPCKAGGAAYADQVTMIAQLKQKDQPSITMSLRGAKPRGNP